MELKGAYVAIVTPMRDGQFDEEAFHKLIEFQIENGIDGIVPVGTTGESATLSHEEHHEVIRSCVNAVNGRVQVIAGTGSNSTGEAIELTRVAKEDGADAALLISPYYNKPPQAGIYQHYREIAEAVEIDQILYNCPGRTGSSISPDTVAKLGEIPNIIGVKDATNDIDWTTDVTLRTDLTIVSGDDPHTLPLMGLGAKGVISVTANIMPKAISDQVHLALDGKWDESLEMHKKLFNINRAMFIESNPVPVKAALKMMGMIGPELRRPLSEISEANAKILREELKRMGLVS